MIPTTCPPPCSLLTPLFGSFSSFQSIDPTKSPAALQISHKLFPVPDQLSTQLLRRKFLSILWSLLYLFIQFWLCWVCCRMVCSLVAVCGLLIAVVSLVVPGLQSIGSIIAAHGLSSQTRDWTCVSCTGSGILYHWATGKLTLEVPFLGKATTTLSARSDLTNTWSPGTSEHFLHHTCHNYNELLCLSQLSLWKWAIWENWWQRGKIAILDILHWVCPCGIEVEISRRIRYKKL